MKLPETFSIFPVKDKKPLVEWGEYSNRLPTPQERVLWNVQYPTAQFGIATGKISKILVLDDDGGLDTKKYPIPRTLTQNTPRGGKHYFFKWIDELEDKTTTKVGILEKVDVRGNGGYVVFYGFTQSYGSIPLAKPPRWLIDLLSITQQRDLNEHRSKLGELLDGLKEGNRNDSFTRIAGSLYARGYKPDEIFILLQPKAAEIAFEDTELRTICNSIGRYAQPETRQSYSDTAASVDIFLKEIEEVDWICEPIIAKGTLGFIAGLPETGKTFVMLDLAIEAARGGKWLGKFPIQRCKVLLVDQERFKGEVQRRLKAILAGKDAQSKEMKEYLFVRCGTTTRLDLQVSYDAFRKEIAELRPDLIIIDSFVTFHTSDENNRQSIQVVLERIKQLRNEFGCTFLFVDHEAKGAFQDKNSENEPSIIRMAGSIAKPAAAELVLTMRRQDSESSMVYMTKSTLAQSIAPFLIKIEGKEKIYVTAY